MWKRQRHLEPRNEKLAPRKRNVLAFPNLDYANETMEPSQVLPTTLVLNVGDAPSGTSFEFDIVVRAEDTQTFATKEELKTQ